MLWRIANHGPQCTSIRYSERLAHAGIAGSVGSVGDSFDNALAETINGLFKTALIKPEGPGGPWNRSSSPPPNGSTGSTTAGSTSYCGDIPPAELEDAFYAHHTAQPPAELTA